MILRTFTSSSFAVRQRRRRVAVITAMVVTAGACSGDEGAVSTIPIVSTTTEVPLADPPTTDTPPSSVGVTPPDSSTTPGTDEPPPTTAVPTTDGPTTVVPTTVPLPTSPNPGPDERLRATIARDFLRAENATWEISTNLRRKNLEQRVARVAVKDSPAYFNRLTTYLDVLDKRQRIRLGEPPTLKFIVEEVEFVGRRPYERATVTLCSVNNIVRIETLPDGTIRVAGGSEKISAVRTRVPVRRTAIGWNRYTVVGTYTGRWEGAQACPER